MAILQVTILAIIFASLANTVRFKYSTRLNQYILLLTTILLIGMEGVFFRFTNLHWILFLFIYISVVSFNILGAIFSFLIASILIILFNNDFSFIPYYLIFIISIYVFQYYTRRKKEEKEELLRLLIDNSKQLNIFKEVSSLMQQTVELKKLLQTILTSVTAGYGLGFNRAIILLVNEDQTKLNGVMGAGPMTAEEGYDTWERLTKNHFNLIELIKMKETEESTDLPLNESVKQLEIDLNEPHFLYKALHSGKPLRLNKTDHLDTLAKSFFNKFNMTEIVVFPLIHQKEKLGILIIDNLINTKPITEEGIESVIPLANQAAIAIQQSNLYEKIEGMALHDGLTGLLNQRAFQTNLEHYFKRRKDSLAVILLDIDFFKHFNDTNGHLQGNQVLVQLAEVIRQSIRTEDIAFRFGGEEFIVLLPNTKMGQAREIAERIRENVEMTKFPFGENQPGGRLTVSIGVASTELNHYLNGKELVEAADQALYKAKGNGKNRVEFL